MRRAKKQAVLLTAIAIGAFAFATPAAANPPVSVNANNCNPLTPSPNAVACSGFWSGNVLDNNSTDLTTQHNALNSLGFNFNTSTFGSLTQQGHLTSTGLLNFGETLYGLTYIGVHFGGANTGLGNRTVFYEFNFGTTGNTGITLNTPGFSNAVLYATRAVPEPATWGMMLLGFAGIGFATRRRRSSNALMQVA